MSRLLKPILFITATCVINLAVISLFFADKDAFGGPQPSGNGDVNGDQLLNIADPVYMLSHLFSGGPAPVAIAGVGGGLTADQEEILSHLSIVQLDDGQGGMNKTLRVSGVNLQIVNGLGATNGYPLDPGTSDPALTQVNGLGNLIVGYNEPFITPNRTGSHNLVGGFWNDYSAFGGLVTGLGNSVSGRCSAVTGGSANSASGAQSAVTGGQDNHASGSNASVTGGQDNIAGGTHTCISGGKENWALVGSWATVSGGLQNQATGSFSSVSGGATRTASGDSDWRAGSQFEDN